MALGLTALWSRAERRLSDRPPSDHPPQLRIVGSGLPSSPVDHNQPAPPPGENAWGRPYEAIVNAEMSRGSQVDFRQLLGLRERGFRSVVNLRDENNVNAIPCRQLGLRYLRLAIPDGTPPTRAEMKVFLDFASDPKNQPVYVHCLAGIGRTSCAVACYRMAVDGFTADEAVSEATEYLCFNTEQIRFIRDFKRALDLGMVPGYPPS